MDETQSVAAPASVPPEAFRLKAAPILTAVALGVGIYILSQITVAAAEHFLGLPERPYMPWIAGYYEHAAELGYALLAIVWIRRRYADSYGLCLPEGRSYLSTAILWGLVFGVATTIVDYAPQVASLRAPDHNLYPLTTLNVAGWLSFEGLFAGPSEEVLFRGLLVTYLAHAMPGRISFRGYTMNGAGMVVAVLFALTYAEGFLTRPFAVAIGQQLYAFVLGIFYAYWYEKSRSLLAPIVGHSVANAVEYALIFAMVAAWH